MKSLCFSKTFRCFLMLSITISCVYGAMRMRNGGDWPENWPEQLEPLRGSATTGDFSAGSQATYYYIEFSDREQFERVWPCLLQVKSKGAPLTLMTVDTPKTDPNDRRFLHAKPTVLLACPAQGNYSKMPDGSYSHRGDWTEDIESQLTDGVLPQFVGKDSTTGDWTIITNPRDPNSMRFGFLQQSRVEIILYIDGEIIDMNRIRLPENTPIEDRRKLDEKN